jgi:hypothetical protein
VRLAPAALLAALAIGGCGSGGPDYRMQLITPPQYRGASAVPTPDPALDRPASAREEARLRPVLRAWAAAISRGDSTTAAGFFRLPAVIHEPGQSPVTVVDRAAIAAFNAALPCGAQLVATSHRSRYVVGTFAMKDRPGKPRCADAGHLVEVGFVSDGRRFTEFWQQAPQRRGQAPGPAHRPVAPVVDASAFPG